MCVCVCVCVCSIIIVQLQEYIKDSITHEHVIFI